MPTRIESIKKLIFNKRLLLYLVVITALATACRSKKGLQLDQHKLYSEAELIRNFLTRLEVDFYSGKAKLKISSGKGTDRANLYLRSRTDSVLWMSGKRLSVEGGRMQMDNDTATLINRLEKNYKVIPLDTLETVLGFTGDLRYLQDMILGVTPQLDTAALWQISSDSTTLVMKSLAQNLIHKFVVDRQTGWVTGGQFESRYGASGYWTYGDYRKVTEQHYLPFFRKYEVQIDEDNYLSLEMNFSEMEINEPKAIRFQVPAHYTRIN